MPRLRQLLAHRKESGQRHRLEVCKERVLEHVSPGKLNKGLCELRFSLQQVLERCGSNDLKRRKARLMPVDDKPARRRVVLTVVFRLGGAIGTTALIVDCDAVCTAASLFAVSLGRVCLVLRRSGLCVESLVCYAAGVDALSARSR
jgi:hypothetical protein